MLGVLREDPGRRKVRVGLIDTGVDGAHEDLRGVLRALPDVGRALGRVVAGRGSPRDLGQLMAWARANRDVPPLPCDILTGYGLGDLC